MQEKQIVEGCKKGDRSAQRELYDNYVNRLLFVCRRYISEDAAAEDLLHDTFIKIFHSFDKFVWRGDGSLRAWMERIAVNMSIEHLRKKEKAMFDRIDDIADLDVTDVERDEVSVIDITTLMSIIDELPDGYRAVFNLYCVENYSHKEIGEMLGINEKSSASQLARAKSHLAKKIKEYLKSQD